VLPLLHAAIAKAGGTIKFNSDADADDLDGLVIDCRGIAARDAEPELRGVKGEMIIIESAEVELARPVRLIHPRFTLYVIPRGDGRFMLGATSIESEDTGVSVRSALELLGAAYTVHPAFGEARILEFGSGLRPAFPDNLPRIRIEQERIHVNGLYRHGFLLAPALAELTLAYLERGVIDNEVMRCA
jgi:glycine oxidase